MTSYFCSAHPSPSEKGSNLKGKKLLPIGANSFRLEKNPFQNEGQNFGRDSPHPPPTPTPRKCVYSPYMFIRSVIVSPYTCIQSNSSNIDGSFTMANSNQIFKEIFLFYHEFVLCALIRISSSRQIYCAFDIFQKVIFCLALYTEEVNFQIFVS